MAGLFLFIHFCVPSLTTAQDTILLGGFAKVDITPSKPVMLSGYEDRRELSTGVHDPLSARAAVFQCGQNKIVIVSTDILYFHNGTDAVIRQAIMDEFHLRPNELLLTAIHTHAAPTPILDEENGHANNIEYTQNLQKKHSQILPILF